MPNLLSDDDSLDLCVLLRSSALAGYCDLRDLGVPEAAGLL